MFFAKEKRKCFLHSNIVRKYARIKHKSVFVKKKKKNLKLRYSATQKNFLI